MAGCLGLFNSQFCHSPHAGRAAVYGGDEVPLTNTGRHVRAMESRRATLHFPALHCSGSLPRPRWRPPNAPVPFPHPHPINFQPEVINDRGLPPDALWTSPPLGVASVVCRLLLLDEGSWSSGYSTIRFPDPCSTPHPTRPASVPDV